MSIDKCKCIITFHNPNDMGEIIDYKGEHWHSWNKNPKDLWRIRQNSHTIERKMI